MSERAKILLTGATGYVGGRLLPRLEERGLNVRCLTRRPETLLGRVQPQTEVVRGDLLDAASLDQALEGVDTAYYFVHSMGATRDFEQEDRTAAKNFVAAADRAGVRRIIYLGGLGQDDQDLSKHLRSRQETGKLLRQSDAQVIEFRASIVIGSGSLSFELVRTLVERLPMMICPRWVSVKAQPIAVEDVLDYLSAALDLPEGESRIIEIGGPDQVSYGEIMKEYARQRGLRRLMISVPLLTPYLSSLWLGLVTPVYARIGRKLIESLRNPTLVSSDLALELFDIRPRGLPEAIERSLINEDREFAQTRWSDALSSSGKQKKWGGVRFHSRIVDSRTQAVPVPAPQAFAPIRRIGGKTGWYYGNWLWKIRGFLDLLVGGVGVRRGRRDPQHPSVGDALDFWRVEKYEPDRLLTLHAEMKVPGRAWLEFEVTGDEQGSVIRQTAIFDPRGLFGLAYWYALYPLHQFVFAGMLRNIARAAEQEPAPPATPQTTAAEDRQSSERPLAASAAAPSRPSADFASRPGGRPARVAVIGAGISGLLCARQLADSGLQATVLEKSRGVGGRMATRRTEGGLRFDHGAQYFTVRDEKFAALAEQWRQQGVVAPWEGRICTLNRGELQWKEPTTDRFVGVPGMNAVCRHLAAGLDVRFQCRVRPPQRQQRMWHLQDEDGGPLGEFDLVVVSAPAPQAAELLADAPILQQRAAATTMQGAWAAMLSFERSLDLPFDGAFVHDSLLSWAARDNSKPQRAGGQETWVLHASSEWTAGTIEQSPDEALPQLLAAFWQAVAAEPKSPAHAACHRWRYSIPPEPLPDRCLFDEELGIGACGDWCSGPRVEGAALSGLAVSARLLDSVGVEPAGKL